MKLTVKIGIMLTFLNEEDFFDDGKLEILSISLWI